jgi:deazaflavin-dependent oxidoreductase (nitroreductase family)
MSNTMESATRRWGPGMRAVGRLGCALHRGLYRASGGRLGGMVNGVPVALLTTRGRRTGRWYTWPVGYLAVGEEILLAGSAGGSPHQPGWYHNVRADPRVALQIGDRTREMIAEIQAGPDRERAWEAVVRAYPVFAAYQRKVARQIPVVLLRPAPPTGE